MNHHTQHTPCILAGGYGTRVRRIHAHLPKSLFPVAGAPFLCRLLAQLKESGHASAILCTGFLSEQFDASRLAMQSGLRIDLSQETQPLGTAGALRNALVKITTGHVLVMNGDSYCHLDLGRFIERHFSRDAAISMVVTKVKDASRFGKVAYDARGRVTEFIEKGATSGEGYINAGIYLMKRAILASVPDKSTVSLEKDTLPKWIGRHFMAYPVDAPFLDIGTPASYRQAEDFFKRLSAR